jgi:hypothetical protein
MIKEKYKAPFFIIFFFIPSVYFSLTPPPRTAGNGTRINFGPVIGFYSINKNHATRPSQKPSLLVGFKREIHLGNEYKTFFLFGIDYFLHGLNFKSYYFDPDSLKIYDKSFSYSYSVVIQELNLPLQVKYLFKREDNSLFSSYVTAGYHLRYLLPGSVKVSQNGNQIIEDQPEIKFKNPLFNEKLNSFASLGVGWQKNSLTSSKGSFFVELNLRYGFSPYYFETSYTASSLYINSLHLSLQLGLKF